MTWPERPVIHEVNTAVWLDDISRAAGRQLTLAEVPAAGCGSVATSVAPIQHDRAEAESDPSTS